MAIALFGRLNEEWLRTFLELPHGIPSHDTLGRVFARLDAARFEECFRDWVQAAFKLTGGQVVPIDGKCLRGSHDRGPGPGAPASGGRLGRSQPPGAGPDGGGQQVQRDHGHPGVAAHALPGGCIVTLDAMARRKKIARQIREQGADCVLRVRANHKGLHARLQDTWDLERAGGFAGYAHDYADTVGKGHGRIESRRCWTTGDPDLLAHADPDREWRDLASLVRVESERRCGDRVSTEVRGFISSLPPRAKPQLEAVRKHWAIENAHHWVLDVAFGEDGSRIRTGHAAHNMAIPSASPTTCCARTRPSRWALPTSGWPRSGTRTTCAN